MVLKCHTSALITFLTCKDKNHFINANNSNKFNYNNNNPFVQTFNARNIIKNNLRLQSNVRMICRKLYKEIWSGNN